MIGYRARLFVEQWHEAGRTMRLFLAWNAGNTVVAFALLVGAFGLLVATNAPGFQRTLLLGYIVVAVAWLLSIFTIGPVYDRIDPAEA
jgi:hypothetical protein